MLIVVGVLRSISSATDCCVSLQECDTPTHTLGQDLCPRIVEYFGAPVPCVHERVFSCAQCVWARNVSFRPLFKKDSRPLSIVHAHFVVVVRTSSWSFASNQVSDQLCMRAQCLFLHLFYSDDVYE